MAKRYVLSTKHPVPGNCNHLLKSGHYCANRVRSADHCAAKHPVAPTTIATVTAGAAGRIIDSLPEIEANGDMPLAERLHEFGERLMNSARYIKEWEENHLPDSAEALLLRSQRHAVVEAWRRFLVAPFVDLESKPGGDEQAAASVLAAYVESLQTDAAQLLAAASRGDHQARIAGWTEGIELAISHLEEVGLLPEEIEIEDSPGPLDILDGAISSLPEGHRDRSGLIRARELLAAEGAPAVSAPAPSGAEPDVTAESVEDAERSAAEATDFDTEAEEAYLREWAAHHKVAFANEGECGFGRECVGITTGDKWVELGPSARVGGRYGDRDEMSVTPGARAPKGVKAYHKHDCLAVLGRGPSAVHQLYLWVKSIEAAGLTVARAERKPTDSLDALFQGAEYVYLEAV